MIRFSMAQTREMLRLMDQLAVALAQADPETFERMRWNFDAVTAYPRRVIEMNTP